MLYPDKLVLTFAICHATLRKQVDTWLLLLDRGSRLSIAATAAAVGATVEWCGARREAGGKVLLLLLLLLQMGHTLRMLAVQVRASITITAASLQVQRARAIQQRLLLAVLQLIWLLCFCQGKVSALVCWLQDGWQVLAGVHPRRQRCGDEVRVTLRPLEQHEQVCCGDVVAHKHMALHGGACGRGWEDSRRQGGRQGSFCLLIGGAASHWRATHTTAKLTRPPGAQGKAKAKAKAEPTPDQRDATQPYFRRCPAPGPKNAWEARFYQWFNQSLPHDGMQR
jgi:hypothetical protein